MKKIASISMAAAVAALALISGGAMPSFALGSPAQSGYGQNPPPPPPPPPGQGPGYGQDRDHGWEMPPSEFDEISRQGFHDGIEGARRDFDNHRPPNPRNRDEFRHPRVPRPARDAYRRGFERGYRVAWDHIEHGR